MTVATTARRSIFRRAPRRPSTRPAPATLSTPQAFWVGALIVAAQLPHLPSVPGWVALAGTSLVVLRLLLLYRDRRRAPAPAPRWLPWVLALVAFGTAAAIRASYGYLLGREPCVALLFVLVGVKFLEARSVRDGVLLVCLSSFLLVTPFFHGQSLLAAVASVPAVVLIGATLDVLARTPRIAPSAAAAAVAVREPWHAPLRRTARLVVLGVPLAAVLFVLFPRLAAPLWGLPADHAGKTGLSERMSPGSISELSLSDAIAFRVDFDGAIPVPAQRYWRGPVLSRFDGREWSIQLQRPDSRPVAGSGREISYTVTLEPHYKPWLFALDLPSALPTADAGPAAAGAPPPGAIAGLTRHQQLISRNLVTQPLRYRQRSRLSDHYPSDVATDATDNLRLPLAGGVRNPRTRDFAQALRAQHADDAGYIAAVLAWFTRENFVYTLAPPLLESNPVDGFLFDTRSGFCEHYAGAFVVLLRAAGIPARVVTGYQGGEINPRGGYLIVRQSDAHAWAEALVDGEWRRYDPTAAVAPSRIEMGLGGALPASADVPMFARLDASWLKSIQLAWDAVNHDWRRQVVGFNYESQRALLRDWKLDQVAPWQYVAVVAAFALAWVAFALGWLTWRRGNRDRAVVHWQALCARLARAGLPRLAHEGPIAYAERAAARWPSLAAQLRSLAAAYATLRYGPQSTQADTDRARAAALARLERGVTGLPRPSELRAMAAPQRSPFAAHT